jgi:hypothetical protein
MAMALNPGDRPIDLLVAGGSMPIPRNHPAYCGDADPPRRTAARRRSATLAMVAGLLSIAAFSGGAAHYMLRLAEPRSDASFAVAARLPDPPPPDIALSTPAIAPAAPTLEPAPEAGAAEAMASADPPVLRKKPAKRSIKAAKLLSLARRQKPATVLDGENLAFAPHDEIVPTPMLPPRQPIQPTPKADR